MSTSIFSNLSFDAKIFQLPGKCLTPGISCFLSILSRDTTMSRFSLNTGNIFRFLGSFLPASPGIFNFQSCLLSSAPYLFTKLLKPLVKKWRTEGKSIVVFLDDGLGAAADYTKARISSLSVYADLLKSGFVPNEQKSLWEPTQVITWLGTVIDTCQCIISATNTRIQSLSEDLSFLLDSTHPSLYQVRKLAIVCGKIISLGNCVGDVARLMTRNKLCYELELNGFFNAWMRG